MNFRYKFRHLHLIPRPQFPVRVQNFIDLATFSVDFCILYAECPPYFYLWFVWPTDLESIPHASTPTSIIPTMFEVDMTIHSQVIAFCLLIVTVTLWPFDVEQLTYIASHVTNLATKFEDTTPIQWVITFPVGYVWECVCSHCTCAKSRDAWVGGQKQLHFWNPQPRFAYSLCNIYWATTTIQGHLHLSITNAKALDCVNFLCVTLWPWPSTV